VIDTTPSLAQLGAAARRRRLELDLHQEELAARTGLHRTYIGGVERGERNPTWRVLAAIASGLHIGMSELVERAEREL
jgi:transcriptional regulator with XRE-family HTH domain